MIVRNAQRLTAVKPPRRPSRPRVPTPASAPAPAPAPMAITRPAPRRAAGLSLVEMLISLAITAMLLTATMVAIDASFKAYATAAETASAQASTRMVVNRLLTLVRTSIAVGGEENPVDGIPYIDVISQAGDFRVLYDADARSLFLMEGTDESTKQPLLDNVEACTFTFQREPDDGPAGLLEVTRATIDLEVAWDHDNTLSIEANRMEPIRAIASTMPRRLN